MSEDRQIPSTKTLLRLSEQRLEEAGELADQRVKVHVAEVKAEHQREIRLLNAKQASQMNSIENWEEKHEAYVARMNKELELKGRNKWLEEQLEGYKAQTGIQDLSRDWKFDPRAYGKSIKQLCEQIEQLKDEVKDLKQKRGVKRSLSMGPTVTTHGSV